MLNFWVMSGSFRDGGYRCLLATDITLFQPYVADPLACQGVSIVQEFASSVGWSSDEDIDTVYCVEYFNHLMGQYVQVYATDLAQLQASIALVKRQGDVETVTTHHLMRPSAKEVSTTRLGELLKKVCAANPLD